MSVFLRTRSDKVTHSYVDDYIIKRIKYWRLDATKKYLIAVRLNSRDGASEYNIPFDNIEGLLESLIVYNKLDNRTGMDIAITRILHQISLKQLIDHIEILTNDQRQYILLKST